MSRITLSPGEVQALYDKLDKIEKFLKSEYRHTDDPILSTEQVISFLNVSRRTLQTWRDNGIIQFAAIQNKFYYRLSDINKMIVNHLVKSKF